MANVLEDRPDAASVATPEAAETDSAAKTSVPMKRAVNVYWQPKPSDMPALSVLVGFVGVALVILALVIALVGNAPGSRGAGSSGNGEMGAMPMPMPASGSTATYPVDPSKVPAHHTYD